MRRIPQARHLAGCAASVLGLFHAPLSANADSAEQPESLSLVGSGGPLLNMAVGLIIVLVLILALAWLARRMTPGAMFNQQNPIKIVAALSLGTRERLMVVDVGGQQILLGVTARDIRTLHVFESPVVHPKSGAGSSEFGQKLRAILNKKDWKKEP